MMNKYSKTGKCIWCGKTNKEVSFNNAPHILPRSLGGEEIGFDVCDECNAAFGTSYKGAPNVDLVFKEIFNVSRLVMESRDENTYKQFKSVFFNYYHNKKKFVIKSSFALKLGTITKQFKRALFEVFLQKYHYETKDGNNPIFEAVRKYARYGEGDLKVYYIFNNIVLAESTRVPPRLLMSQQLISDMFNYGVFNFWFWGFPFYLEVIPTLFNVKGFSYLKEEEARMVVKFKGNERMIELNNIMEIDFLMNRFNDNYYH